MKKPASHNLFILVLLAVLILGVIVVTWRQTRQAQLNRALIPAVDRRDIAEVRRLLRQGADANAQVPLVEAQPIWQEIRDRLLRRSVPPTPFDTSPLQTALDRPDEDIALVSLLIAAGADVNRRFVSMDTLLMSVLPPPNTDLATTPLILAVAHGKSAAVQLLLTSGARVNGTDGRGRTALTALANAARPMLTGRRGYHGREPEWGAFFFPEKDKPAKLKQMTLWLLQAGAKAPDDDTGYTLLSFARTVCHDPELIAKLKQAGARE